LFRVQEGENKILKTASGQVTVKGGRTELPDSTEYESDPEILALLGKNAKFIDDALAYHNAL
jgi:hypothetical protein